MKLKVLKILCILLLSSVLFFIACEDEKQNESPSAHFTFTFQQNSFPVTVSFNASESSDNDGEIISYAWDFGDGASGTGVNIDHSYDVVGEYTVKLTVTDNDGAVGQYSASLNINLPEAFSLLKKVRFWAYQLQEINYPEAENALINSKYDMLVLEPTRTDWSGDETRYYNMRSLIDRLKASRAHNGTDRKLIIGYVDIGEAEEWRWYWIENSWPIWRFGKPRPSGLPEWILLQDPDGWEGNFPVAYWNAQWQDIIVYGKNTGVNSGRDYCSAVDQLIKDGFDGIFLDWVEAYENGTIISEAGKAGLIPEEAMIDFINNIKNYARERDPDFLIIQQNASSLLTGRSRLLQAVDAISQESIWYGNLSDTDWDDPLGYDQQIDPEESVELIANLKAFQQAGLPVFCCEYAVKKASNAYSNALNQGFICYCSRSDLSRLSTTPPPEY